MLRCPSGPFCSETCPPEPRNHLRGIPRNSVRAFVGQFSCSQVPFGTVLQPDQPARAPKPLAEFCGVLPEPSLACLRACISCTRTCTNMYGYGCVCVTHLRLRSQARTHPRCRFPSELLQVYIYILETLRSLRSRMFLARCARAISLNPESPWCSHFGGGGARWCQHEARMGQGGLKVRLGLGWTGIILG